jgi:hypothetical protein
MAAWSGVWRNVDNRRNTSTLPTSQNSGFPQVHNPYNDYKKNTASS